jgi:hypothetical protein
MTCPTPAVGLNELLGHRLREPHSHLRNNFGDSAGLKRALPSFVIEKVFVSSFSSGSVASWSAATIWRTVRLILRCDAALSDFSDSDEVIARTGVFRFDLAMFCSLGPNT